jgi:hypothetical protein
VGYESEAVRVDEDKMPIRRAWHSCVVSSTDPVPVPPGAPNRTRVHACQRLLRWSIERAQEWKGRESDSGADLLLLSIHARSTRTYEAVVRWLGERGFGEQGAMLNRSLFEDMVDAHWVYLNPDLAVERLRQHDDWSRFLRAQVQRAFPDWFDGRRGKPPKLSNADKQKLRKLFGAKGQFSWTGVGSLEERLNSVLSCWSTAAYRREVQFMHAWVHKTNNETLHLSAFSIARLAAPKEHDDDDTLEWRFGATTEWLPQALSCAYWVYSQTVGLVCDRFGIATQEELGEVLAQGEREFRRASHWERTGRLEPLPDDLAARPDRDEPAHDG